jgi:RNA polymerase sigma-70 factor, ECF subfamily
VLLGQRDEPDEDLAVRGRPAAPDLHLLPSGVGSGRPGRARNIPGRYQLQAAINAVHADAESAATTDWRQIVALYDQLLAFGSSPIVSLNRAGALAEVEGPKARLEATVDLPLDSYYLLHAVRADLLRRLGLLADAVAEYDAALALTDNRAERSFLQRARDSAAHSPRGVRRPSIRRRARAHGSERLPPTP